MSDPATSVSPSFASATQTGETSIKLCRPPPPSTSQDARNDEVTDAQEGITSASTRGEPQRVVAV